MKQNALVRFFDSAHGWYGIRKDSPMPKPSCMINPDLIDDLADVDHDNPDSFAVYYTKSEFSSKLASNGAALHGLSTHVLPLFGGIQALMTTEQLAKVIEHHSITVDDYEEIFLAFPSFNTPSIFHDCMGGSVQFLDAKIQAWKAFDSLGMIRAETRVNADESSHYCAMHTECEPAWPINVLQATAKESLKEEGEHLMKPTAILGEWYLKKDRHFPDGDPLKFLRRCGMLSSIAYRKQLAFHSQWEDLCLQTNDVSGHLGLKFMLSLKGASTEEQLIIKDALRAMHPDRGGVPPVEMHGIFEMLSTWLGGTDMDVSDSLILKINLSGGFDTPKAHKALIKQYPNLYPELNQEPQHVLGNVCREILSLRTDQISYADLAVFRTIRQLEFGKQVIEGFKPEDVIMKLDAGMRDFLGSRTKTNDMTKVMFEGLSAAFKMLSVDHTWDYKALQGCSELTVLALVRAGGSMGKLPDMGRTKRGMFLEDELGL
jgi:hypothetical protein